MQKIVTLFRKNKHSGVPVHKATIKNNILIMNKNNILYRHIVAKNCQRIKVKKTFYFK